MDVSAINSSAVEQLPALKGEGTSVDCLIVPGYTPRLLGRGRRSIHPEALRRCELAATDLKQKLAPLAIVSGGAVHSAANEAVLMREALMAMGIAPERILLEPCARHSTTNLRNAGRIMLQYGLRVAEIVTSDRLGVPLFLGQAFYFGYPRRSTFHWRCRRQLGYEVGELAWIRPHHVSFVPSADCLRESPRPTAEGDR